MKGTVEEKTAKAKLKTQSPVTQISRKPSTEKNPFPSAKVFLKNSGKVEGEHKLRMQSEKQSPSRVPRTSSNQKSEVETLFDVKTVYVCHFQATSSVSSGMVMKNYRPFHFLCFLLL